MELNEKLKYTIQEKNSELHDMFCLVAEQDSRKTTTQLEESKQKRLLITDSNRKKLNLDKTYEWNVMTNIYTLDDLEEQLKSPHTREDLKKTDKTIIMLGTNNTRKGESASTAIEKMKRCLEKIRQLTDNNITLIQIPPMGRPIDIRRIAQTAIYNTKLKELQDDQVQIITTQEQYELEPKTSILQNDGYHLTQNGADYLSNIINQNLEKQKPNKRLPTHRSPESQRETRRKTDPPRHQQPEKEETQEMRIEDRMVKHIMGKEGKTHKSLQRRHNIKIIITDEKDTDRKQKIILQGESEAIRNTKKEIRQILDNPEHKVKNRDIPCRYFERDGNCFRGSACQFMHDPRNIRTSVRSRSSSRDNRNKSDKSDRDYRRYRNEDDRYE